MHYQGAAAPAGETDHAATRASGRPGPCASTRYLPRRLGYEVLTKWRGAPLRPGQVVGARGTCHKDTTQSSPEAFGPGSEREAEADSNRPAAKDYNRASTNHKGNRAREVPGRNTSRGPPGRGPGVAPTEQGDNGGAKETALLNNI